MSIPRQISVVGFDDLLQSRWLDPPLTTVHQPATELGAAAVWLILPMVRGETHVRLASSADRLYGAVQHRRTPCAP